MQVQHVWHGLIAPHRRYICFGIQSIPLGGAYLPRTMMLGVLFATLEASVANDAASCLLPIGLKARCEG